MPLQTLQLVVRDDAEKGRRSRETFTNCIRPTQHSHKQTYAAIDEEMKVIAKRFPFANGGETPEITAEL